MKLELKRRIKIFISCSSCRRMFRVKRERAFLASSAEGAAGFPLRLGGLARVALFADFFSPDGWRGGAALQVRGTD